MSSQSINNMTHDELNQLIEDMIDRRLQGLLKPQDNRSNAEILASIKKHRFTLPEGAKSPLEMLREDRDA